MKHLNPFNELSDMDDLEDCLVEVFDKFHIVNKVLHGDNSTHHENTDFYYFLRKGDTTIPECILIGFGEDKLNPIKIELNRIKSVTEKRLCRKIKISTPPNPNYIYVTYHDIWCDFEY